MLILTDFSKVYIPLFKATKALILSIELALFIVIIFIIIIIVIMHSQNV